MRPLRGAALTPDPCPCCSRHNSRNETKWVYFPVPDIGGQQITGNALLFLSKCLYLDLHILPTMIFWLVINENVQGGWLLMIHEPRIDSSSLYHFDTKMPRGMRHPVVNAVHFEAATRKYGSG